ncbi:MAG: metallopeptidase TldD-related protein [Thermocrinis sp.]
MKGVVIGGNILELMKNLVGVGEDLRMYGHVGSPSLLVEAITVGG